MNITIAQSVLPQDLDAATAALQGFKADPTVSQHFNLPTVEGETLTVTFVGSAS